MLEHLSDQHPLANWLGHRNLARQYDFMNTSFLLWREQGKPKVSLTFLCELNLYAVQHLSPRPGEFRYKFDYNVIITGTDHKPPPFQEVESWMADFLINLHYLHDHESAIRTAAYALWRLNWIHPFAQGNGRSSRALCYFLLCQRYDLWFPGTPVHELIKQNRDEYCELLRQADKTVDANHMADLSKIEEFLERLMAEQISSVIQKKNGNGA